MAVPYTFATQTTSIPLAQLDTNFSTPVTIGTTTIPLGNIAPILENVTLGNVVIASGNVTLTNVNVINATITTANVTTANITSAFITTANVTTANITTANVVTIRATTANLTTANVTAMEAVAANVTTIRSTTANITTANVVTIRATTANIATANVTTAFITTANIATANVVTIRATTANIATANVTAMEAVAANVTTLRSTNINVTTANATTAYITTANVATANVTAMEAVSANVTTILSTTANLTTANVTTAFITTANIATANVVTIIATTANIATANVTTLITAEITDSGNLTFTGTGNRITGDFSNGTVASRVMLQTSTANSNTNLNVIPSGTAQQATMGVFNNSDPTNSSSSTMLATATESSFRAGLTGTGTYLPMTFYTGGSEKVRIDTSGNVGIGLTPAASVGALQVSGSIFATSQLYVGASGSAAFSGGIQNLSNSSKSVSVEADPTNVGASSLILFNIDATERMRIDSVGNTYVEVGNLWEYSPAPTALAAGANAGTAAQLRSGMFSAAQTTAVTLTMPTGTAIDTGFTGVPAVDIGFYFYVINTGSALGAVTVAVNTNVTSLGSLVVAIGTSAQFRLRRTAANTYIMYRLS